MRPNRHQHLKHSKIRGVTLVEVIMGALVLVILFSVIFRLFRSSTSVLKAGMWVNGAQLEVRNTLTFLRDEINRSSPFSKVTPSGVVTDTTYTFAFKKGEIQANEDGPIFKFYQCRTGMAVGSNNDPGGVVYCEVWKEGDKLFMKKERKLGTSEESTFSARRLLANIDLIKIEDKVAAVNEQMAQATINISITVADPLKKDRKVMEETKAKVDNILTNL